MNPMTREEAMALLESAPVAHIGVIVNGLPYVTPMSFVVDGNRIMFRTMAGKKLEGMRVNPVVCVEASKFDPDSGEWASVIVMGTASETDDGDTRTMVVGKLLDKYREAIGSPLSRGGLQPLTGLPFVVVVEIDDVSGMVSGSGFGHRTKPGRL
jgi:uncharacterized protein